MDGIVNVNARDRILREIVSNTLAHRDYSNGFPSKMIIDDEKIVIENSNLSHGIGPLDLQKFEPFPKNPSISKVFREIGLADELGSGMRNTYKYTQLYSKEQPLFEEGNTFKTIIPLKKIATKRVGGENVAQDVAQDKNSLIEFIKKKVRNNDRVTRKEIADEAGVSIKTIERIIKEIDDLRYVGSGYSGHWEKIGAENVPQDVPQDVPQGVPQGATHQTNDSIYLIEKEIELNNKISRQLQVEKNRLETC